MPFFKYWLARVSYTKLEIVNLRMGDFWFRVNTCNVNRYTNYCIYFQKTLDEGTDPWGVKVERVEV